MKWNLPSNGFGAKLHYVKLCHFHHQHTGRGAGVGGLPPPQWKKNSIILAKLMYRSGKDTVKNILLFHILIYLFSSRNSPNLVTDLSNGYVLSLTSWFSILERLISIYRKYLRYFEHLCSHSMAKKTWRHKRIILCICDQQVSFGQLMLRSPQMPMTFTNSNRQRRL